MGAHNEENWHGLCVRFGNTYCRMGARWALQQTTLARGSDETRARDPLVRNKLPKIESHGCTTKAG